MKRIKHIIPVISICLFASMVMSQNLQISVKSGTLANGTNIYIWGDSSSATIMYQYLTVKNISTSATITVKAKKIETSLITGAQVTMCFATVCDPAIDFISSRSSTLAPNAADNTFSGEYKSMGHLGESIIIFEFFDIADKNDSAWVVVHFNATPSGINEIASVSAEISNPYPNPSANFTSFNYTFLNNNDKAKFVITNIIGSKLKEINLPCRQGISNEGGVTINTSDLKDGIYMCGFFVNEKLILTKRLIVQH